MSFLGRKEELRKLSKFLACNDQQACLVLGRRRVGKSALIKEALQKSDIEFIYYECKQTSETNNVQSLARLIAEKMSLPRLDFRDMEECLTYLVENAAKNNFCLVLDEYPYLRDCIKGLDSILQCLIDKYADESHMKLILCGSFVDVMKSLLLVENPLYGRINLTIDLKPMDYYEASLFYPDFCNEDKVRLYSVFGGIPYYNKYINHKESVKENIIRLVSSQGAMLENEVMTYLKSEISKMTNANEIFESMARGFSRYSDILSQSHVSSSPAMADVLDKLIRMNLVKKQAPINDENNKRKSGYYISDNLSLFYYRFIFRNTSQQSIMSPEVFYNRYIDKEFEAYHVPLVFEEICKQYLIRLNWFGEIPVVFDKIGKYYYDDKKNKTNGEFDIVTQDPEGFIFYEAKFRKEPITQAMIEKEIQQVKATGLYCYKYGFFSKSGFSAEKKDNYIFYSIDDLYV